jgi:hypothetical protein
MSIEMPVELFCASAGLGGEKKKRERERDEERMFIRRRRDEGQRERGYGVPQYV